QKTMQLYVPHAENAGGNMTLIVRSSIDPLSLVSAMRAEVRAVDKDQPAYEVATLEQILADSMARQRFSMMLLAVFAAGALLLAAIGIYGVLSYTVTQRMHEFGIRLALGAEQGDVLRLVLRDGIVLVVIGLVVGLAGAFAVTRAMTSLLFGVSAADPLTFAGVALVLSGIALL